MLGAKLPIRLAAAVPGVYARGQALARPVSLLRTTTVSPKVIFVSQRTYATPGRPKKAVGEPSKTVKRDVKRAAADKTKPTKAASKLKNAPKKKEVVKEKAPLTDAQKERLARIAKNKELKLQKAEIAELKKIALPEPKTLYSTRQITAWMVYNGTYQQEHRSNLGQATREASRLFKELSASELEHYNHLANEQSKKHLEDYQAWIQTHTPDQIRLANKARSKLRAKFPNKAKHYRELQDDRLVRGRRNAYIFFQIERQASGDFKNIALASRGKLIAPEWKALSESEKQKYIDLANEDDERYKREVEQVYGHASTPN